MLKSPLYPAGGPPVRVSDEQVKCSGVARATMQPPSSSSRPLGRSITARLPSGVDTSHTKFTCLGAAAGGWAVTWAVTGSAGASFAWSSALSSSFPTTCPVRRCASETSGWPGGAVMPSSSAPACWARCSGGRPMSSRSLSWAGLCRLMRVPSLAAPSGTPRLLSIWLTLTG